MTALRTLIVDDEPLALERLSTLLDQIDGVEIIGAVETGNEAIARIEEMKPDLVLLDIEMPKLDGFDVVEALQREWPDPDLVPLVCFITAYPHFASEAFDAGALDFLCKPVRIERLQKTIERARTALVRREAGSRLKELLAQLGTLRQTRSPSEERSIWLSHRGEMVRLPVDAIGWIKAEGEYVRLHLPNRSYLLRNSITHIASELVAEGFVRVHRSIIINSGKVSAVRSTRGGMKVELADGTSVPVGRRFRKAVQLLLESDADETSRLDINDLDQVRRVLPTWS